jgi:hypothetical protein
MPYFGNNDVSRKREQKWKKRSRSLNEKQRRVQSMCPVGALGFYMVERFHIDLEPFPDFSLSQNWYNIKVYFQLTKVTQIWK